MSNMSVCAMTFGHPKQGSVKGSHRSGQIKLQTFAMPDCFPNQKKHFPNQAKDERIMRLSLNLYAEVQSISDLEVMCLLLSDQPSESDAHFWVPYHQHLILTLGCPTIGI